MSFYGGGSGRLTRNWELFQICGAREGNLPRKPLLSVILDHIKSMLLGARRNAGHFTDSKKKEIWAEALLQFSVPYIPWNEKIKQEKCYTCGCTCRSNGYSVPRSFISTNKPNSYRFSAAVKTKMSLSSTESSKNGYSSSRALQIPLPRFFVPGLRHIISTSEGVDCCRYGALRMKNSQL